MEYNKDCVVFVENFASPEECKMLKDYLDTTDDIWNQGSKSVQYIDYIGAEHDQCHQVLDENVIAISNKLTNDVQKYLEDVYLPGQNVKIFKKHNNRGLELIKWKEYSQLHTHSDGSNTPPDYPLLSFGTLIYLNDEYSGGEIGFDDFDISFKPKTGSLVIFPNHLLHHVKQIMPLPERQNARRYTLPVFWIYLEDLDYQFENSYVQMDTIKVIENGEIINEQK